MKTLRNYGTHDEVGLAITGFQFLDWMDTDMNLKLDPTKVQ